MKLGDTMRELIYYDHADRVRYLADVPTETLTQWRDHLLNGTPALANSYAVTFSRAIIEVLDARRIAA